MESMTRARSWTAVVVCSVVLAGCVAVPPPTTAPVATSWTPAADSAAALALFRANIDAIHKRNQAGYLATYLQSPRLVRSGPEGPNLGFENWSARERASWPDTLIATDLRVVPIAPGVVYGTYRFDVRYGDSTSVGISERVFVRTPEGWRIAVTTAFGTPLRFSPRR
jgi:outer membrane murein-binding lipoprotein Lpp